MLCCGFVVNDPELATPINFNCLRIYEFLWFVITIILMVFLVISVIFSRKTNQKFVGVQILQTTRKNPLIFTGVDSG